MLKNCLLRPTAYRSRSTEIFTQDKVNYSYQIYDGEGPPSILVGVIGDIWVHKEDTWLRDKREWVIASKEVDKIGRPIQNHPTLKSKRRLLGVRWLSQSHWNNQNKKRKMDDTEGK